jgi:hypothetical protein
MWGWLLGSLSFALLMYFGDCVCEIGFVGTFIFFEVPLTCALAALVIVVGIPCFKCLARRSPMASPSKWAIVGGLAFAISAVPAYWVGTGKFWTSPGSTAFLAAICGSATFYIAKRRADASS